MSRKLSYAIVTLLYWSKESSADEISLGELVTEVYDLPTIPAYVVTDHAESLLQIKSHDLEDIVIRYLVQSIQKYMESHNVWLLLTDLCNKGILEAGYYIVKEFPS